MVYDGLVRGKSIYEMDENWAMTQDTTISGPKSLKLSQVGVFSAAGVLNPERDLS